MGTIPPQELLKKWEREEITAEMAIGHILQYVVKVEAALETIKVTLSQFLATIDSLITHPKVKPNPKRSKKPPQNY